MKQTDIDRHAAHAVKFIVTNVLTQEDALAVGGEILNERGLELLKAHPVYIELDEK